MAKEIELNGLAQIVAWITTKDRDAKWHNLLLSTRTIISCSPLLTSITVDTVHVVTLPPLCLEARLDKDTVDMRRIVHLLGKVVLFPELQACRVSLDGLLEEAKCQDLGCTLHLLLQRRNSRASTAVMETSVAQQRLSTFMNNLRDFLGTVDSKLRSFRLYRVKNCTDTSMRKMGLGTRLRFEELLQFSVTSCPPLYPTSSHHLQKKGEREVEEEGKRVEGRRENGEEEEGKCGREDEKEDGGSKKRRAKTWTKAETVKGVKRFGVGKWRKIMKHFPFSDERTTCSLKDKWRNLQGRNY